MRLLGVLLPRTGGPTEVVHNLPIGSPVQLVEQPELGALPRWEMVINPHFAEQLHWRTVDQITWRDIDGELVATAYSWLDGEPDGELQGEHLEGEGAAIVLNAGGREQWNAVRGGARTDVLARQKKQQGGNTSARNARATNSAPNQSDGES